MKTLRKDTGLYNLANELVCYGDAYKNTSTRQRVHDLRNMGLAINSPKKNDKGRYTVSKTMRNKLRALVKKAV